MTGPSGSTQLQKKSLIVIVIVILQTMYGQKKNLSTFSYKLVQISPIMILVNSGAFLSISSWFCELTELIFVMIPYISSTGCPPTRKGLWDMWKWRIGGSRIKTLKMLGAVGFFFTFIWVGKGVCFPNKLKC